MIKHLSKFKNFYLCALTFIFLFTASGYAQERQQIKVQTEETQRVQNGECSMNIENGVVKGIVRDGVCTLPEEAAITTTPLPNKDNSNDENTCEIQSLFNTICNESLVDILGIEVPKEAKDIVAFSQVVATILTIGTLTYPIILGLASPGIFLPTLFIIIGRRKKKPWGLVYEAKTKKPIPFATIRLMNARTDEYIKEAVSDTTGRFSFLCDAGEYYLVVRAFGFKDINKSLDKSSFDAEVYTGGIINIRQDDINLSLKVPMLRENENLSFIESLNLILKRKLPDIFKYVILTSLISFSLALLFVTNLANILAFVFFLVVFIIVQYNHNKYLRNYGHVFEVNSNQNIPSAFVRLLDSKTHETINDLVLTDSKGRFTLLASDGNYELNVETGSYSISSVNGEAKITSPSSIDINYSTKDKIDIGVK